MYQGNTEGKVMKEDIMEYEPNLTQEEKIVLIKKYIEDLGFSVYESEVDVSFGTFIIKGYYRK